MSATDPVQAVAEALWAAVDDGGIRGRIFRDDATVLAEVAIAAARPAIAAEALRAAAGWIEAHPEDLDCEAEASGIAASRLRFRADRIEADQ